MLSDLYFTKSPHAKVLPGTCGVASDLEVVCYGFVHPSSFYVTLKGKKPNVLGLCHFFNSFRVRFSIRQCVTGPLVGESASPHQTPEPPVKRETVNYESCLGYCMTRMIQGSVKTEEPRGLISFQGWSEVINYSEIEMNCGFWIDSGRWISNMSQWRSITVQHLERSGHHGMKWVTTWFLATPETERG